MAPQFIDEDIARQVAENLSITDIPQAAVISDEIKVATGQESFWREQFRKLNYKGSINCSLPKPIPEQPKTWKSKFADHWMTSKNWKNGNYRGWMIPTGGHVCLMLDGEKSRAISASFPCAAREPLKVWDLETGKDILMAKSPGEGANVTTATIHDSMLVTGSRDGDISVMDLRSKETFIKSINRAHGEISTLSTKNELLVAGTHEGCVYVGDLRKDTIQLVGNLESPVTCSAISRGENTVVGTLDKKMVTFNNDFSQNYKEELPSTPNCVLWQGNDWIAGLDNGEIIRQSDMSQSLASANSPVVCMHRKRDILVSGHADGTILRHHLEGRGQEGKAVEIKQGQRSIVWQVSVDASRILSSSLDSRLDIHDFGPSKYYSM